MKSFLKPLGSLLLVTVMTCSLMAGCGGSASKATNAANNSSTASAGSGNVSATASIDPASVPLPSQGHVKVQKVSGKPLTIAFLSFQNNPFWDQINEGRDAAIKYLKNFNCSVDYTVMGDQTTADKVNAALDAAIVKSPDAVVVCPMSDGTEAYVDKVVKAGIPVVTYLAESTNQSNTRLAFVGQDAASAGKQAGEFIAKYTGGKGSVGVITGNFTMTQHEIRRKSMVQRLHELAPNVKIAATVEAHDLTEATYNAAKDMITAYPDLKAIYCTAGGPFGAAQAVKEMGMTGKIGVVCYDWVPDNVKYVKTGEIVAAISQDPQGMAFDSIVMAYNNVVAGWKPEQPFCPTKSDILTPENIKEKLPNA